MNRRGIGQPWVLLVSIVALATASTTRADALSALQLLRESGCGGILPKAQALQHSELLDRVAQQWAMGTPLPAAALHTGYRAQSTEGLHLRGPDSAAFQLLRRSSCRSVTRPALRDVGFYRRGADTWFVLATAYVQPSGQALTARALQLVNDVRARGARCGERIFAPAPPVRLSSTLGNVALGHAADMAERNYFEHMDLAGQSPADRVRAVGYREKLVGENIAYGPETVDEVVQGWLDSPGHCENIMDPRFAEMGLGYASGQASTRGPYWVQVLAAPRT